MVKLIKPIIELKSIKIHYGLSEETFCFTANLWIDGSKICQVSNHGHGGSDDYDCNYKIIQDLEERIKLTFGQYQSEYGNKDMFDYSLEILTGEILNQFTADQEVKKILRKVCYFDGKNVRSYSGKKTEELLKYGRDKLKVGQVLLNDLPIPEAKVYIEKYC